MILGVCACILSVFLFEVRLVNSSGRNEVAKVLLISAEYLPYDVISSTDINLMAFQNLTSDGCVVSKISVNDFVSSAEIHSAIMSGGIFNGSGLNMSHAGRCDQVIHSKISPYFEPLWLANQRHGMKSGSYYWPGDFVAVNGSRPYLTAGSNPRTRNAYFDIDLIYHWLLDPSITFLSIFIPPPPHFSASNFILSYVEYIDSFLSTLLSYIKKSPVLSATVNIIFVGGTAAVNDQNDLIFVPIRNEFQRWPLSAFNGHFKQGTVLEFWPTSDELDEEDLRLLTKENSNFFTCNTEEFHKRNPGLDTGLLPPYYLVAESGRILEVDSEIWGPRDIEFSRSGAFVLLWGKAFTTSPEVCGDSLEKSNRSVSPIRLFDIYPLVCWTLGLQRPWLNQGNLSRVSRFFKTPPSDAEVAELESRARDWSLKTESVKFNFSNSTLLASGTVAALAITLFLTFIICALKHNRRSESFNLIDSMHGVRYHKRRIRRPWNASASASSSHSYRGLLDNHNGDLVDDASEEEEVLMENDALDARKDRKLRKENAKSFIQMLHSPTANSPSLTRA